MYLLRKGKLMNQIKEQSTESRHYIGLNVSVEEALEVMDQLSAEPKTKRFIDGLETATQFRRKHNDGLFASEAKYLAARVYSGTCDVYDLIAKVYDCAYRRGYKAGQKNA